MNFRTQHRNLQLCLLTSRLGPTYHSLKGGSSSREQQEAVVEGRCSHGRELPALERERGGRGRRGEGEELPAQPNREGKWVVCGRRERGGLLFIDWSSGHVSHMQQVAVMAQRLWVACFGCLCLESNLGHCRRYLPWCTLYKSCTWLEVIRALVREL
jgi:hypothetical protein